MQDKATQEFEDILRQNPNVASAQRGAGYAYLRKGNMAMSREHFRAATKLGSTDPRTYYYSAVLLQQANPDAAGSEEFIQDLKRAMRTRPAVRRCLPSAGLRAVA